MEVTGQMSQMEVTGQMSQIVDDIGNGNVPISPDPARLGSTTVGIDETATLDIFTETGDDEDFGTALGDLAPFDNQTGEVLNNVVSVVDQPTGAGVGSGDLNLNPTPPLDTDDNGLSSVDASYNGPDVQGAVTFRVAFNASSNQSQANDVVNITFQPSVGDTGTISGEIAKINEDIQLGTDSHGESNTQPAQDVPVWAVQTERVIDGNSGGNDNTVFIEDNGTSAVNTTAPNRLQPEADTASPNTVALNEGDSYRVVTYPGGEANVLDVRSDYVVTTPDGIEVIQNETSQGFDIHKKGNSNLVALHFLEPTEYQVQQLVTWTNTSTSETVGQSWQNISVNADPSSLYAAGTSYKDPNDLYTAGENLTLDGVDARYDDEDRIVPIDYTNENGDFELLNLPTTLDEGDATAGKDYLVIAGAGDTVAADGTDKAVGFANFRGHDIVTVKPNAQAGVGLEQRNVDLSVQDYEVVTFSYELSRASALVNYDTITLEATVGNGLDEQITRTVPLLIDGEVVDEREVTLAPGETTTVTFERTFAESGTVTVTVGDQVPTTVEVFVLDVDGNGNGAQDLTGDGLRNDVNGDGLFTLRDVQTLFDARTDSLVRQYGELFDFAGDGTAVGLADVEALFEQYLQNGSDGDTTDLTTRQQPTVTAQSGDGQAVVYATVGNGRDEQVTTTVPLLVDGEVVAEREVTLAPGETTTLTFEQGISGTGLVRVRVGSPTQTGVDAVVLAVSQGTEQLDPTR
jgi:hypothetical protein